MPESFIFEDVFREWCEKYQFKQKHIVPILD